MLNLEYADDVLGNEVRVGDTIAAAFCASNSAELRVGKVIAFKEITTSYNGRKEVQLEVEWSNSSESYFRGSHKPTRIKVFLGRFVKLS